jgi:hypothetical protein
MQSARYLYHISKGLEFSGQIFEKHRNAKFDEVPSSGSRVVTMEWTERKKDIRPDTTNLKVAFLSFSNVPNNNRIQNFFVLLFSNNSSLQKSYHIEDINCLQSLQWAIFEKTDLPQFSFLCKAQTRTELQFLHRM